MQADGFHLCRGDKIDNWKKNDGRDIAYVHSIVHLSRLSVSMQING
jgi:hypothetical protein